MLYFKEAIFEFYFLWGNLFYADLILEAKKRTVKDRSGMEIGMLVLETLKDLERSANGGLLMLTRL